LEPLGFVVGVGFEPVFGDAQGADAVGELVGVAFAVGFEGVAVLVVLPAVEFDDEVVVGEVDVDDLPVERVIDQRGGRPYLAMKARKSSSKWELVGLVPGRSRKGFRRVAP
jgi:hypothetical protein